MTTTGRLEGRYALITGASRGIGRAIAVRFAREGATVAVNFSGSHDAAEETLRQTQETTGGSGKPHMIVQADVRDEHAISRMFDEVLSAWGHLDILVNNAGIQSQAESHAYAGRSRIPQLSDPIREAFARCLLFFKNAVHISGDMRSLGNVENYPLLALRQPCHAAVQQLPGELSHLVHKHPPLSL